MTGRRYIAENGTEITDELVDRWAEEAENGFPGAEVTPVRGARVGGRHRASAPAHHPSERYHGASHRGGCQAQPHERKRMDQSRDDRTALAPRRRLTHQTQLIQALTTHRRIRELACEVSSRLHTPVLQRCMRFEVICGPCHVDATIYTTPTSRRRVPLGKAGN